ncbi:unnamed protein product [Adineta steineri]|uniref:CSC1/OSCA1-like cytosolic domain-containing protein n=1 Tax=Adineta steineri TaxID=433720 RepID=A0A815QHQ1_9BILA|nr:unnamed protein product [Adineta steineri]CAF3959807.1 unnamed protein product [Adineta steineri]
MTTPIRISSLLPEKSPTVTRDDCSYYGRVNTTGFGFIGSYEGIPENILVNLVVSSTRWLWIRDLFIISDWDVYRDCSPDAYYYLLFHTYLITYLLFVTIFSLATVLTASRTLMIRGIPHEACNEEKLNEYFKEAYPAYNITHLTLAYNIAQLQHCYKRRELNLRIWQQSKKMFEESGKRPVVYNNKCGQMCGCCAKEVDAIEYYEKLYNTYKERVEYEYLHVRTKKCGLAFVTFSTPVEAHRVRSNFQPTCFAADRRPKPSIRVTKQIQVPIFSTCVMSVLLLCIFAAAMPSFVSVTSLHEKQWKKSALDKSMMIKLFVYLSMMILILQSSRLIRYS